MGKPSRTTMAKRNRERALQEKRQEKMARKQQRRLEKSQGIDSPAAETDDSVRDGGADDDSYTDDRASEDGN
jgi:hypothetical protein